MKKKILLISLFVASASTVSTFAVEIDYLTPDPVLPEVCGPTQIDLDLGWNGFQGNYGKISENKKINQIANLLNNYFNRKKLARQIENVLYNSCDFPETEKRYIKREILDKYQEYKKTYDNTVNSWYSLVPILERKLEGDKINKETYNYHIKIFVDNIRKLVRLQRHLENIHYAKIEYLTNSDVTEVNNPSFDTNWKEYNFKNMLANGKQLNYFKLIYNKNLHSDFNPYNAFSLIYLGNLTKGFKVIALTNN